MTDTEASRLERLWAGPFGDAYVERNRAAGDGRDCFWQRLLAAYPVANVLEVGCNIGANLQWLAAHLPARDVNGVDISETALQQLRQRLPNVNACWSPARTLPFRDGWFDLVFTAGVLIHQPESALTDVMAEIVRCSRRYVLCLEYFSPSRVEIPYRGETGALFKDDFGGRYRQAFPALQLVETGELGPEEGWDHVTWWLLAKTDAP
jgi:spore coat polysaccharide biosynthesis protein SpsF